MHRHASLLLALLLGCGDDGGAASGSTATDSSGTGTASTSADTSTSVGGSTDDAAASTSTGTSGVATGVDSSESTTGAPACGDMLCSPDEDATTCCADCGICSDGATVRMQTGIHDGVPGAGLTPGGIADTHAQFVGGPFAEIVYPFTIEDEPFAGSSWFWAQQFFFEGTTEGGYIGLQANGILGGQVVGKMLIGSIWNATEATPGAGSCEPFGGEGVGQSCRLAFEWRENVTYRMIVRESQEDWWSIIVLDPATNTETLLGDIHVPPEYGRIRPPTAGFAEYYGEVDACETLPYAVALLHAPIADGAAPTSVDAGTYGTCAFEAISTCMGPLCR